MTDDDPFLWLEEVEGAAALAWVRAENARSLALLEGDPRYADMHREALAVITAPDRIPYPGFLGDRLANFWQDDGHVRGCGGRRALPRLRQPSRIGRRCSMSMRSPPPRGATGFSRARAAFRPTIAALSSASPMAARTPPSGANSTSPTKAICRKRVSPPRRQAERHLARRRHADRRARVGAGDDDGVRLSVHPEAAAPAGTPLGAAEQLFAGTAEDVSVGASVLRDPDGAPAASSSTARSASSKANATCSPMAPRSASRCRRARHSAALFRASWSFRWKRRGSPIRRARSFRSTSPRASASPMRWSRC